MKNDWKESLKAAFDAPEPGNKKEFLRNIRPREVSTPRMLFQQVQYIRGAVWIFALMIMIFALLGSWKQMEETEDLIPVIMPFLAAISVLETRRSRKCGMIEIEMVTRFSLRSVILARMLALGLVYLFTVCVISPVIAAAFGGKALLTAMRILIPYLITMSISLQVERSVWGRKLEYASLAIAAAIAIAMFWIKNTDSALLLGYTKVIENCGVLIVLVLAGITAFEQWKTINNVEEFA